MNWRPGSADGVSICEYICSGFIYGAHVGYAYGANVGWINLGDPSFHYLVTDSVAMGADTDADGMAEAFESMSFGAGNLSHNATTDSDGDGRAGVQEYRDGTDPNSPTAHLRITAFSTSAGGTSSPITRTSVPGRLYKIETTTDLSAIPWADMGLTLYPAAAPNTTTSHTVSTPTSSKRFFRVRSVRPLSP